nr:uncharacterized protein LOC109167340 [Ipomoea trifida]
MVDITEDDVVIVLGFPRGTIEIERKKKKKGASFPLRTEFKEKLQANDAEKVSYPALIEAMLECNNGDSPQNGSVGTQGVAIALKDQQKEEINNGGFCQDRIEARYAPTTADSATAAGNIQGPSPTDPEVQPQRQASPQVEPECPVSSKVQTGPVDDLQVVQSPLSQEEVESRVAKAHGRETHKILLSLTLLYKRDLSIAMRYLTGQVSTLVSLPLH